LTSFLALYRGESVGGAKLITVTAQPELVRDFAARMLVESGDEEPDAVLREMKRGRRRALQLVKIEASE
jgi:hypothetical protein